MKTPEDEEFERIEAESGWRKRQIALDQKAENAKELGLDYKPRGEEHMTEKDEKHWTMEDFGIPHTQGYLRFYLLGFDELVYDYLGWFDMNDWDEGWKKVWQAAEKSGHKDEDYQLLRHDQMVELMRNVQGAFELALEEVNPVIAEYWSKKEKNT